MCDSVDSSKSAQPHGDRQPILMLDDMSGGSFRKGYSSSISNVNSQRENMPILDDQSMNTDGRIENSRRKRNFCDIASASCIAQTPWASKSTALITISPNVTSSYSDAHSHTKEPTHHLSTLQRMMDMEKISRSVTTDHKALRDVDPFHHKRVWRERVAQWCYDVLDYLDEPRDVAAVAMNIIDRYLAVLSKEASLSTSLVIGEFDYEVISFTALFLAIRVSGSNKELEISELLQLSSSSGVPQVRHIVSAGNSMLKKLSWNHQILTPNSFLRELSSLMMIQYNEEANTVKAMACESLSNLVEFASYLVEVSVCDIYFSSVAPSKIAFGALALAMMCNSDLFSTGCQNKGFLSRFFQIINQQTSINIECAQMNSILSRLLHAYNQSQEAVAENIGKEAIQWKRSGNNGSYQTALPHIIVDEAGEFNTIDGGIFVSNKSGRLDALPNNDHPINTSTNQTRPVSPLPCGFL